MPVDKGDAARFHPLFARWATRVRRRLAVRHALTGAAIGLAVATLPAAVAWRTGHGALRPYAPLVGAVGVCAGLAIARKKRWSDTDVALYLDERLATEETIATALELEDDDPNDTPRGVVITRATAALTQKDARDARPTLWKPVHALVPLAALGLALIARAPMPAQAAHAQPPGTANVQIAQAEGLERVAKLARTSPRDDAQRERLDKLAHDAEKLKEELRSGLEKRDAQDKIARLKDAIAAERLSLGEGEKRAGLERAVGELERTDATRRAARALGDHDLETMDAEMERLANQREAQDRALAKEALKDAEKAAKSNGAPDVAKTLEEERKLMERRAARAEALRDIDEALRQIGEETAEQRTESEALDREKNDEAARRLANATADALGKLTPEERKRLAEKLRQMARSGGVSNADPDELRDLADAASTPEGQKRLEEQLREMAKDESESAEADRQRALDDAQNGAGDTERDIGKQGQGQQGQGQQGQQGQGQQGQGQQGQGQQGQGQQGQGQQGQGQQGGGLRTFNGGGTAGTGSTPGGGSGHGGHDVGTGDHQGSTKPIDADTLKSRPHGPMNKSHAMPGAVTTFTPGKAGGTANQRGTGDLRAVGPSEVDGVDRSDVPEEYRDHVRQYFQP
jgi:hypothetical protein